MSEKIMIDYLILGCGYTGEFLKSYVAEKSPQSSVQFTNRVAKGSGLSFKLSDASTWTSLPDCRNLVWLFAAEDLEATKNFWNHARSRFEKTLVVSSTGFFEADEDSVVTEKSPLQWSLPRVQCEEYLRDHGASIIHAAGIYGPKRNPLDWYQRGLIKNLNKWLNLVHVEDLAQFIWHGSFYAAPSMRYIASDGSPRLWTEILSRALPSETLPESLPARIGKRIDNSFSRTALKVDLKYPDIFFGLQSFEGESRL